MPKKTHVNVNGTWKNVKVTWTNVAGVWKKFIPKGNISGIWKEFIQYMFKIYSFGTEHIKMVQGHASGEIFGIVKHSDRISIRASGDYPYRRVGANAVVTDTKIDLTNYTKIKTDSIVTASSALGQCYLVVSPTKLNPYNIDSVATMTVGSNIRAIKELDISSLSGEYYIRVHSTCPDDGIRYLDLYQLWLE